MKKHIFLYLFIFAALVALYQFVSTKSYVDSADKKLQSKTQLVQRYSDSIKTLNSTLADERLFTLQYNEEAISYHERYDMEVGQVMREVEDAVIETNIYEGEQHPLIPYAGINGRMKINSVKFLNHKWVIADFSDSQQWGDLLIRYDYDENDKLELRVVDAVLYP